MKKSFLLILGLLVTACGPAGSATEGTGVADESSISPTEIATESSSTEPSPSPVPTRAVEEGSGESQVDETATESFDSTLPARTLSEATVVRESDHVMGADDPLVTIIEYGDFQ